MFSIQDARISNFSPQIDNFGKSFKGDGATQKGVFYHVFVTISFKITF
jgi:hypothetical protein